MKLSPPTRPSEPLSATPADSAAPARAPRRRARARQGLTPLRWYMILVLLPTLLLGAYYAVVAADLYESEARFLVRARAAPSLSGAAAAASMFGGGGGLRAGTEEIRAVNDFVLSHDAVSSLRRTLDLVGIWRRPEADLVSMLWWSDPEAERLLRYYRRRVTVEFDIETGISTLRILAYRPADARDIAEQLLALSEDLVNRFSTRTSADGLRVAREELVIAERRVLAARAALAAFREREQALDPAREAGSALDGIARLEGALSQARAELQERRAFMRPDNPQIQILTNRIAALTAQIAVERARITQGDETMTQRISDFERLQLEREFADRQLASATASLEQARADAQRQQHFLLRVVEPNLPERALFPQAMFNTVTVLVGLTVVFGIGWLLIAGAREHTS